MTTARRKTAPKPVTMASVEPRLRQLEHEVGEIKDSLRVSGDKLDQLLQAYTRVEATRPQKASELLSVVKDCAYLFALVVGGIIWISSMMIGTGSSNAVSTTARLDERLKAIEMQLPRANFRAELR